MAGEIILILSVIFFIFYIKMIEKLALVICSRDNSEQKKEFVDEIKRTCGCDIQVYFILNPNGISLTQIYSEMITSKEIDADVILFIHDDIDFLRKGWGKELLRLFKEHPEYGIIGVAGSAQFDEKGAWWNYEKKYGQVLHRHDGKSWLTAFSPLLKEDLKEVAVIDGLFIAVHKKRITKNFDTSIKGFNMYDIDFCLANYLDGKTKIGVTTNIRIAHNSIGELKPEWYENRKIINEKYGEYFPIDIEK